MLQPSSNNHTVNLGNILPATRGVVELVNFQSHPKRNKSQRCENISGVEWYYYLVPNDKAISLMDTVGQGEISQKFVTCLTIPNQHKPGKITRIFAAFDSHVEFLHYIRRIPKDHWCFFEVILGNQSQKLYFDIDVLVERLQVGENPDLFCNRLLINLIGRIMDTFRERGHTLDKIGRASCRERV